MPHAWMMVTPCFSWKPRISDSGTALPPHSTRRSELRSTGLPSQWWSMPVQMLGTAPANVGRSFSIMATSGSGCSSGPGMRKSAPTIHAA
jgi:hypothetical protein